MAVVILQQAYILYIALHRYWHVRSLAFLKRSKCWNVSHCWLQYWDDPADGIQEREGTLLPLWRFTAASAQGQHVTALAWNPAYPGGKPCAHPRAVLFWTSCCRIHEPCWHTGTLLAPSVYLSMNIRSTSC